MMGQAAAEGKNKKFENIKKISRLNIKAKSTKDKNGIHNTQNKKRVYMCIIYARPTEYRSSPDTI